MPQKTNLNISPYFDDLNFDKNFYKVLFKPGFPVQARELTTLQSILQHQLESFGSNIFKEGSMVIPGSITYDNQYHSVQINPEHLGIDVSIYLKNLINVRVRGQSSGVSAVIKNYSLPPNDGVSNITIYVKYLQSDNNAEVSQFKDGEILVLQENVVYANTALNAGDTVVNLIENNATSIGSAVGIDKGVYFIRGFFVDVPTSTIVLNPFNNKETYRVGFDIIEDIVSSYEDPSLNDNARGFTNYAAPGADRLRVKVQLAKKSISDFIDKNFIELIRVDNGEVKKIQDKSTYSILRDYIAQRTYEESGDYSLTPFSVEVSNSLNDGISSNGIYASNQKTEDENTPSDDLMCISVSSGKAYVRGYDINIPSKIILDAKKPRDGEVVPFSLVPFEMGNLLKVNNVFGTPFIGLSGNDNEISFYNERRESNNSGTGQLIGKARVYSFNSAESSYSGNASIWDLYLYDVQTYTVINLNSNLDSSQCPKSSFIRGLNSGASGYTVSAASGGSLTLVQTSGQFVLGEEILINEISLNSRSITSVRPYTVEDIKSVYQDATGAGLSQDFVADTVLYRKQSSLFNLTDTITITPVGIASAAGKSFSDIKPGSIITYQIPGYSDKTFNRVASVSSDGSLMQLDQVPTISGICQGNFPLVNTTTTFSLEVPAIKNEERSSLYTQLGRKNVFSVDLSNSGISLKVQIDQLTTDINGSMVVNISTVGISSAFFDTFESERYSIHYSNGSIEPLSSDQFTLSADGTQISLNGLKTSESNITLNATIKKVGSTSKTKTYVRSKKITVSNTISGFSTSISGLTPNQFYGLRIEDTEISLGIPDVVKVIAVYESLNTQDPILDKLTFSLGLNLNTQSIVGEKVVGSISGAIGQLVTRLSSSEIEFVYLNSKSFISGEPVLFQESKISANIQLITPGSYSNLTNLFTLDKGHKEQYYDYSKIVRNRGISAPSRRLLVIFDYYEIMDNDSGDLITANSYTSDRFLNDIPILKNNLRATDVLDFRPRVSKFTSDDKSPFEFNSRVFSSTNQPNPTAPNESSIVGYSHYLPRIDRIVLNKLGEFSVIKGIPANNPAAPLNVEEAMDIATIYLPAYLYDPNSAVITLVNNRRYTMKDIKKLDDRIQTLEITTSLSLLELNTKSLQIQDADGLSRFKTGFFVDDFKNDLLINKTNSDVKCSVLKNTKELIPASDFWSLKSEIALSQDINSNTADFSANLKLLDPNVRKTGDLITLNYDEVSWLEQPFASNVENVNPFNVIEYVATIKLQPSSDNWVRYIPKESRRRGTTGQADGRSFDYIESITNVDVPDPYMRSRNVEFNVILLKPLTQYYAFLDNTAGIDIIPKLLEINMSSGVFQTGEDIAGFNGSENVINFRLATQNHKNGNYLSPSKTYSINPYDRNSTLPSAYSASSTILNIDTYSFAEESLAKYGGYLTVGTKLVGKKSGAIATVSNIRLISDIYGNLTGCFFIKDPNTNPPPTIRFPIGDKSFRVSSSSSNSKPLPGSFLTILADAVYASTGIIRTETKNIVEVRNPPPPPPPPPAPRRDPLAQSFTVDETGAFLTSVEVYFGSKDPNEKLIVELRTVELGTPTKQLVQDYAFVELDPDEIKISSDASVPTKVTFPSPIYLQPQVEYALVFLAPTSDNYEMWVGTMGQKTIETQNFPDVESIRIARQYTGGSLFKSQNGTIWTPSQFQDLKFKLYKAKFISEPGDAIFYNPPLRPLESNIPYLKTNAITTLPRKLKVGITTTSQMNSVLIRGRKISQDSINPPYGFIDFVGGPISSVSVASTGSGYVEGTFSNVPLYSITGSGFGAEATVVIQANGCLTGTPSITKNGHGYTVGDVLGITTSSIGKGSGVKISVSANTGVDTLYLTGVQGEEFTDGVDLVYYNGSNPVATANTDIRGSSSLVDPLYTGNIFEVSQYNHGMQASNNVVQLKNVKPDTVPVVLTSDLDISASLISIANTEPFTNFEGISTSKGYIRVNDEIIYYNSVNTGNTLGIGTRGVDGTLISPHYSGSICQKYELSGVSLMRINATLDMPSEFEINQRKDFDNYYLRFNRGDSSSLSFTDEKLVGGSKISVSQNYQYSSIIPQFNIITPGKGTTVSAQIQTVSGTSVGGLEPSFQKQPYQPIELNKINFLSTPRLVCSEINESFRITDIYKNKSLTLKIRLSSDDPNLSPVIDTQTALFVLGRSRINSPVMDYASDSRVNLINGDPHSSVYISNRVDLKQPATSLKVLISACRPPATDFRVLYQLYKVDSSETEQSFILFPGYDNLKDTNGDGYGDAIINSARNSGRADALVRSSKENEFLEYQFTADNLEQFNGFSIKIVMSSTNESKVPRFKDLRAIALV